MPITEARKKANRKWDDENLKRFTVAMKRDDYETAKMIADHEGKNMNRFICDLVLAEIVKHIPD